MKSLPAAVVLLLLVLPDLPFVSDHTALMAAELGAVRGTVKTESGEPLPFASVALVGTNLSALCGDDGEYLFKNVVPDTYVLRASYQGYIAAEESIQVASGIETTAHFNLKLPRRKLPILLGRKPPAPGGQGLARFNPTDQVQAFRLPVPFSELPKDSMLAGPVLTRYQVRKLKWLLARRVDGYSVGMMCDARNNPSLHQPSVAFRFSTPHGEGAIELDLSCSHYSLVQGDSEEYAHLVREAAPELPVRVGPLRR